MFLRGKSNMKEPRQWSHWLTGLSNSVVHMNETDMNWPEACVVKPTGHPDRISARPGGLAAQVPAAVRMKSVPKPASRPIRSALVAIIDTDIFRDTAIISLKT